MTKTAVAAADPDPFEDRTRECEAIRCHAPVVDALIIGAGAHKKLVINPQPTTWAGGGRFRLSSLQYTDQRPHVVQLRTASQAFGTKALYADHRSTCAGGSGVKTRSKEAST